MNSLIYRSNCEDNNSTRIIAKEKNNIEINGEFNSN